MYIKACLILLITLIPKMVVCEDQMQPPCSSNGYEKGGDSRQEINESAFSAGLGEMESWQMESLLKSRLLKTNPINLDEVDLGSSWIWSPDGLKLIAAEPGSLYKSDQTLSVIYIDCQSRKQNVILREKSHDKALSDFAFSPSGNLFAITKRNFKESEIIVFRCDLNPGEKTRISLEDKYPCRLSFSDNDKEIAAILSDGTYCVWDISKPAPELKRKVAEVIKIPEPYSPYSFRYRPREEEGIYLGDIAEFNFDRVMVESGTVRSSYLDSEVRKRLSIASVPECKETEVLATLNNMYYYAISPTKEYLAVSRKTNDYQDDNPVSELGIWDIRKKEFHLLLDNEPVYTQCKFAGNGKYLIAFRICNWRVWDLETFTEHARSKEWENELPE